MFTATKADYVGLLKRLSPRGKYFHTLSTGVAALYAAIASAFADAHNSVIAASNEAHPSTADQTLDQWLAAYGLPEPGMTLPASTADKRALLMAKITTTHGQGAARMIAIATACGVVGATVTEWFDAGQPVTWKMNLGSDVIAWRWGTSKWGDKYTDFTDVGNAARQQIERAKPANTIVIFTDL